MEYDFTTVLDRHGKDAMAVDAKKAFNLDLEQTIEHGFDRIPMWVADMNFATAPSIQEEIIARAKHPAFGYYEPSDAYWNAISSWHIRRKRMNVSRNEIGYQNGVLGGVASALRVLCSAGDAVLVHSPTYIGFTGILQNNGYRIIHSPLQRDDDGIWRMDLNDMEEKIEHYHIHSAIFCSPHNPCGRVWSRGEIRSAMELFRQHDVYVIADEIWSDLILPGHTHVPTQSVSEDARQRTVALYAPSKTFNLAGLIGSYDVIYHPWLRDRIAKQSSLSHYNTMNVLSMHALIGAYSEEGEAWLEQLIPVLEENVNVACQAIATWGGVSAARPEGTYMMFLDCAEYCHRHGISMETLLNEGIRVGVIWQDGRLFGGTHTIRLNLASPTSRIKEAFDRLERYVFCRRS